MNHRMSLHEHIIMVDFSKVKIQKDNIRFENELAEYWHTSADDMQIAL